MKKLKIILAAACLLAVPTLSAQTVNDVNVKYNEAAALISDKNYEAAIPMLEQVVEMGLDAGADASATVQQAQKLIPQCYFQYGLSLCRTNRFEEAIPVLEKAVAFSELYQDSKVLANSRKLMSQTYTAMGGDAFNNGDWPKAIEIFSKGYAANPTDTDLALYLAESYAASGDYDNGLKIYKDVVALENRHSRYAEPAAKAKDKIVYYQTLRASEAAQAGNKDEVYVIVEEILSVDPVNPQAHMLRIQTATNNQDWSRIIEWGSEAADAQVEDASRSDVYFMLGAAYQNTENKDAAIANYKKVSAGNNVAAANTQIGVLSK